MTIYFPFDESIECGCDDSASTFAPFERLCQPLSALDGSKASRILSVCCRVHKIPKQSDGRRSEMHFMVVKAAKRGWVICCDVLKILWFLRLLGCSRDKACQCMSSVWPPPAGEYHVLGLAARLDSPLIKTFKTPAHRNTTRRLASKYLLP